MNDCKISDCKISYIPRAAIEEAQKLKLGDALFDAWLKPEAVNVRIYDAADDKVLGENLDQGWFDNHKPIRIVRL